MVIPINITSTAYESPGCYPCLHIPWFYFNVQSTSQNVTCPKLNSSSPHNNHHESCSNHSLPVSVNESFILSAPQTKMSHPWLLFLTPSLICEKILLVLCPEHHNFSPPLLLLTWYKPPSISWITAKPPNWSPCFHISPPTVILNKKPAILLKSIISHHFSAQHLQWLPTSLQVKVKIFTMVCKALHFLTLFTSPTFFPHQHHLNPAT